MYHTAEALYAAFLQHLSSLMVEFAILLFANAHLEFNPIDIYRSYIASTLARITKIEANLIYPALQWTQNLEQGDLNLAVPRLRVKQSSPTDLAREWAEQFPQNPFAKQPDSNGINLSFTFSSGLLQSLVLPTIFGKGSFYGFDQADGLRNPEDPLSGGKKIIVEFSSPNVAKEFHAGHLRSTIIGGFLSNLYAGSGWNVTRMNYLGDWGRQYGLLAVAWERFGSEELLKENATAHLFDIYVKISALFKPEEDAYKLASKSGQDTSQMETTGLLGEVKAYFKRMEDGDEAALALWSRFRSMSIEKYKQSYARLNIFFDVYSGESQVKSSTMQRVETILKENGVAETDRGALIIDFKKHGAPKLHIAIIRNRNGTTNYLLRDLGAIIERHETFSFDKMIYVVMSEQDSHLQRLFKALELMGPGYAAIARKVQHVSFGKVLGMSTRKGNVKFLDNILQDCGSFMHEVMQSNQAKYVQIEKPEKVADILGITAVMVQDMSGKRINNYAFDMDRMTSFEGDTGPYLQYAHARLCSIARKAGFKREQLVDANFSLLKEQHAIDLIRLMAQFPDTVEHTLKTLESATVSTYLFRLTHQLSSSYDVLRVIGAAQGPETSLARAALYEAARQVLGNGMRLLGLSPLERM